MHSMQRDCCMRLQGVDLAHILPHGSFAYGIPVWGISFDVDLDWLLILTLLR